MLLTCDRLLDRLNNAPLEQAYFLYGDEPLQLTECSDALRVAAARDGVSERIRFDVESGDGWSSVQAETQSLSLFASRRLLEITVTNRALDARGSQALDDLLSSGTGEDVIVIRCGALDSKQRKARWYQNIEKKVTCAVAREPQPEQLPHWLQRRATRFEKRLSTSAAQLIAERVEGNLLAAAQEVEKLCLLVDEPAIHEAAVLQAVSDSARYDVFQWADAVLSGDKARAVRVLRGLRAEGTEPPVMTWALGREIRQLISMAQRIADGARPDAVLEQYRIWRSRQPLVRMALKRHSLDALLTLLAYNNFIDAAAKGARQGAPWDDLEILTLCACGHTDAANFMTRIWAC